MTEDLSDLDYTEASGLGLPNITSSSSAVSPSDKDIISSRTIWSRTFAHFENPEHLEQKPNRISLESVKISRHRHSRKRPRRSRNLRMQDISEVSIPGIETPRLSISKSAKLNKLPTISRHSLIKSPPSSLPKISIQFSQRELSTDTKEQSERTSLKEISGIDLSTKLLSERKYQLSLLRKRIESLDKKVRDSEQEKRPKGYANFLAWMGSFIGCGER